MLLRSFPNAALNISMDEDFTASLDSCSNVWPTFMVKKIFLIPNWNFPYCNLQPIAPVPMLCLSKEFSFVFSALFHQIATDSNKISLLPFFLKMRKKKHLTLSFHVKFNSTQTSWWFSSDSCSLSFTTYLHQSHVQIHGNKCISGSSPISFWWAPYF